MGEVFPAAKYQRCTVHFYRNVFSVFPKAGSQNAQGDSRAGEQKSGQGESKLRSGRTLRHETEEASTKIEHGVEETLTYADFPSEHWTRIRTNNVIERLNRELRRRTRVVGCFPAGNSALMLICARLRHVAGTQKYMNIKHLGAVMDEASFVG